MVQAMNYIVFTKKVNLARKINILILLGFFLEIAFCNSVLAEYAHYFKSDYFCQCNEKISIFSSSFIECYQQPKVISYQNLPVKSIEFSWIDLEDEDTSSLDTTASQEKVHLSRKTVINHQDNKHTSKSIPLFLLESSFLL